MFHEMAKPLQEDLGGDPPAVTDATYGAVWRLTQQGMVLRLLAPKTSIGGMQAPDALTQPMTAASFPHSAVVTRPALRYPLAASTPWVSVLL